jgi:hypothetical protein
MKISILYIDLFVEKWKDKENERENEAINTQQVDKVKVLHRFVILGRAWLISDLPHPPEHIVK